MAIPTADKLREALLTILAGTTDRRAAHCNRRVGELARVDLARSPHSTRALRPSRPATDEHAVERAEALRR